MTPASPRSEGPPCRRKSTLICQACDRERHVDDWRRRDDGSHVAIVCPDCDHVLTRRPREVPSRASPQWKRLVASLGRLATGPAPLVRRLASLASDPRRVGLPRLGTRSITERLPGRD